MCKNYRKVHVSAEAASSFWAAILAAYSSSARTAHLPSPPAAMITGMNLCHQMNTGQRDLSKSAMLLLNSPHCTRRHLCCM